MLGASFSDPAPDLSFEPLPNLGNTCWLASVTRLLHTCDLRLPCAMPSWCETVDHMSALGFHDGGQKDPRVFPAAICALYPQWTQDSLWSFNRTASCSVCLSARLIPSDGQFVVDLGLPSDLPTSVSDLISDVSSPVDSHLDCVTCGRVRHVLGSPSPAAHLPFVLFHIRRAVGGVKSRSIVRVPNRVSWFGRIYQLAAATIHIGAVPDTGHYVTVLPPSASDQSWTCLDDCKRYTLASPIHRHWNLQQDATWLAYKLVPDRAPVPCDAVSVAVPCDPSPSCSLQLVVANLTSWFSGWPQLLTDHPPAGACVWLLSETHLSSSAARACLSGLHRIGLHGVFKCSSSSSQGSKVCKTAGLSTLSGVALSRLCLCVRLVGRILVSTV